MERWYVVHTQPRGEDKALLHLERQGFAAYLPRYLKRRRHARRTDWVKAPFFPNYLFVALDPERQRWRAINSTIGVLGLVSHGELPTPVPDGIVEAIRRREDADGLLPVDGAPPFAHGERIVLVGGALDDQIALFDGCSDAERVYVLLDLLGRQVRIKVPLDSVRACA